MVALLLRITRVVATLLVGLFAGGTFFTVLAPSLTSLPASAYVPYWQALNIDYGQAMPVLLLTTLGLLVLVAVLSFRRGPLVFGLTAGAALLVLATIVLTVTQLEPLNNLANSWDANQPPSDWTDIREQWWTLHLVRTTLAMLAFVALLVTQAIDRSAVRHPSDVEARHEYQAPIPASRTSTLG